jgi:hypothetical protein
MQERGEVDVQLLIATHQHASTTTVAAPDGI